MSQPNVTGGQPTSFNTNVNRAKTKKWVEAKSYSYDGDDWGDVDDYDEYGGYDEPEPAPRPTGLRQRGQSAVQPPQEGYGARQDFYQSPIDARQPYGNTSGPLSQQQYGGRSVTNPQTPIQPAMIRTNSFDHGDERRAFSAGEPQQAMGTSNIGTKPPLPPQGQRIVTQGFQSSPVHPNLQLQAQADLARPGIQIPTPSNVEAQASQSDQPHSAGSGLRGAQFPDQQRQGSRTQSMTSNNSSLDFHNRRDFTPSAMPPPLQTHGTPSPQSNQDSRSSSRHPPRKSSLSQDNPPILPFPTQGPTLTTARDLEEDLPVARERADSGAGKPLPFVRPADIYKRMQEEKEKERRSQESSRPSMDSIMGKQNEPPMPTKPHEGETPQRLKPTLDPVLERNSEYGMQGVNNNEPEAPEERRPTTSKKFELPKHTSNTGSQPSTTSLPQMLPDVSRMSGFGDSFFGSTDVAGDSFSAPMLSFAGSISAQDPSQELRHTAPEKDLQHQPSLGFTSAVHQAFDKAEEQVPPTPSSATASTVGRSASGGTSAVSPIISRGPSAATERLPGIEDVTTPTSAESPEGGESRPRSSGSPSTLRQFARRSSPTQETVPKAVESPPPSFIPGHRRDLSTPSPDNSPARTPAVESNRQLRQPQEVEIAAATPTCTGFSASSSSQNWNIAQEERQAGSRAKDAPSKDSNGNIVNSHTGLSNSITKPDKAASSTPAAEYGRNRTDSSSSNRVRNLADKFENGSRPGSAHSTTPRASLQSATTQKDEVLPPRPIADRMESFRPHLPGGWESSASIAPAAGAKGLETMQVNQQPEQKNSPAGFEPVPTGVSDQSKEGLFASLSHPSSSVSQIKDASEEAFTALAEAGSALTGAFAAAVGIDHHDSATESTADNQGLHNNSEDHGQSTRGRNVNMNTVVHPEASRASLPNVTDDELSTAAPTPLPMIMDGKPNATSDAPEYFPSPLSIHQGPDLRASKAREPSPGRQQPTLPLLTTASKPQQYESDRLRKEIVRELTPMSPSEPTTAETDFSNYQDSRLSASPSMSRPGRESGVLPKEYESYWNDADSDDELTEASPEATNLEHAAIAEGQNGASVTSENLQSSDTGQQAALAPAPRISPTPGVPQPAYIAPISKEEHTVEKPHTLPHRFSWEQPLRDLSVGSEPPQDPIVAPTSEFLKSAIYPEGRSFQPQAEPPENQDTYSGPINPSLVVNEPSSLPERNLHDPGSGELPSQEREKLDHQKELPSDLPEEGLGSSAGEQVHQEPSMSWHDDNSANLAQSSSVRSYDTRLDPEPPLLEPPQQNNPSSATPNTITSSPMPVLPPKIPTFREIVTLNMPSERIRSYNDARDQFARLPIGLESWIAETIRVLPEHNDLLTSSGRSAPRLQGHKSSPSRSKLGGLLPVGGQTNQQSHQQQYPNVDPQSAALNVPPQSSSISGGSPQGYSPSGGSTGKISSQQVQAKGKDLLHTAGLFGGKANVAAKGLFSKGKNKLRAASGAEKATNLSSPSLSRGMQQPPNLQAQPTTPIPKAPHDGPARTVPGAAAPDFQLSPRDSQQKSPRDAPSLESFTQSQLGDDERSEESGRISQEQLPVSSSLHASQRASDPKAEPVELSATIGDNAPIFLQETPSADSYVGSPNDSQTPRSASGSNRTPTQASFVERAQPPASHGKTDTREYTEREPKPGFLLQSRLPSQVPQFTDHQGGVSTRHQDSMPDTPFLREASADSFQNPGSGKYSGITSLPPAQLRIHEKDEANLQLPTHKGGQRGAEVAPYGPLQPPHGPNNGSANPLTATTLSPSGESHQALRSSHDHSLRAPDIENTRDHFNGNRLTLAESSPQATVRDILEQPGQPDPVHYGIDHDFFPGNDLQNARDRSTSHTGASHNRASQDSRRSLEANIFTDSAFWQSDQFRGGTDNPLNSYPGQVTRDKDTVQLSRAEQPPSEDASSPVERRSESKPRSRRGSRSSAFFKSLSKPSEVDQPPLPEASDVQANYTPLRSPIAGERKGSRTSILRSLKRNSGSWSSGRNKDNLTLTASPPQHRQPSQTSQITQNTKENSTLNGPPDTSKPGKKLQRASTSGNVEQDSGKKKRFSGIGSLFRRSTPTRSSLVEKGPPPPQQPSSAPMRQRDMVNAVPPPQLQPYDQGPSIEQPPPEGYYAPAHAYSTVRHNSGSYATPHAGPQQTGQFTWAQNAPAYVQDSSLRQRTSHSTPSQAQPQTRTVTQTSTTISRSSQPTLSGVPQSSTTTRTTTTFPRNSHQPASAKETPSQSSQRTSSREPTSKPSAHESRPSGSSWTRFSSQPHSKIRSSQTRPASNGTLAPSHTTETATARQSFQAPARSESPPPPAPPPKDEWLNPRPRHSMSSSVSTVKTIPKSQQPHESSSRPTSTGNRQSLPLLQTNMSSINRNSALQSGKTLTPEEKRKSRQREIERSTMNPQALAALDGTSGGGPGQRRVSEEEPTMSATSFPGQMWQPDYSHWDGE